MRTIELLATAFVLLDAVASLVRVLRGWLMPVEPPRQLPDDGATA